MCLKTVVFCILVVMLVDLVCFTEALDQKGEGVCVVRISSTGLRKRYYKVFTKKWCGKKRCTEKKHKFERFTTWKNQTICCNGWQHNSELDVCAPICSTGCIGGKCVSPDQCQCIAPAYLDPKRLNTCITPTCDPTCTNAVCHANNTCVCNVNYTPYNSTHCFQCNQGYTADENLNCVPVCDPPCANATCTAPNTCSCLEGYRAKNSTFCEPICDCVNANCVAPHRCSCLEGYERVNETVCAPKCNSCSNGDCVAPNNCTCHNGYVKVKGVCKPKCSKDCVNGFCTAPDVCSCKDGFVKSNRSSHVCIKPCDKNCKGYCDDTGCVKWNCSMPIRPDGDSSEEDLSCCHNYVYDEDSDTCKPICKFGCINGICIAVDVCVCKPPLMLDKHTCVLPTCENCEHGDCVATNDCRCHKGYIKLNDKCVPNCDLPCVNGFCAAPNKCTCKPGYDHNPNNTFECVPICKPKCTHGSCVKPDTCLCEIGYKNTENHFICKPQCDGCKYGRCVSPNNCSCYDGFERINSTCLPKCSSCSNGDCVAPETCRCHPGYVLMPDGNCIPNCFEGCKNGYCSAPNKCVCNQGYNLTSEGCMPECSPPCINGKCLAPDNCTCNNGFKMTEEGCKPFCLAECTNGFCSAPFTCTCNDGYHMTENGCKPECSINCTNGYCSQPNNCTCNDGYIKDKLNHNLCYKPCESSCSNGKCDYHGKCKCDPNFDFDNSTSTCVEIKVLDCYSELCNGNCIGEEKKCFCANGRPCSKEVPEPPPESQPIMAGLDVKLISIGGSCLILLILVIIVMQRIWRKRHEYGNKPGHEEAYGSVVYTVPNTLIQPKLREFEDNERTDEEDATTDTLLRTEVQLS